MVEICVVSQVYKATYTSGQRLACVTPQKLNVVAGKTDLGHPLIAWMGWDGSGLTNS